MRASKFLTKRRTLMSDSRVVLLHTRLATHGAVEIPENNHPVVAECDNGEDVFCTHNGVIMNDFTLFNDDPLLQNFERQGQVDSEIVPALISQGDWDLDHVKESLEKITGTMAVALATTASNKIFLARGSSSPLELLLHEKIIVWASIRGAISSAWQEAIGQPPAVGNKAWTYGSEGDIFEIDPEGHTKTTFTPKKTTYNSGYVSRGYREWNRETQSWDDPTGRTTTQGQDSSQSTSPTGGVGITRAHNKSLMPSAYRPIPTANPSENMSKWVANGKGFRYIKKVNSIHFIYNDREFFTHYLPRAAGMVLGDEDSIIVVDRWGDAEIVPIKVAAKVGATPDELNVWELAALESGDGEATEDDSPESADIFPRDEEEGNTEMTCDDCGKSARYSDMFLFSETEEIYCLECTENLRIMFQDGTMGVEIVGKS